LNTIDDLERENGVTNWSIERSEEQNVTIERHELNSLNEKVEQQKGDQCGGSLQSEQNRLEQRRNRVGQTEQLNDECGQNEGDHVDDDREVSLRDSEEEERVVEHQHKSEGEQRELGEIVCCQFGRGLSIIRLQSDVIEAILDVDEQLNEKSEQQKSD
jgi:hypothetical protein